MQISGMIQCVCGKLHFYGGVTLTSACSCGEALYPQVSQEATQRVAFLVDRMKEEV